MVGLDDPGLDRLHDRLQRSRSAPRAPHTRPRPAVADSTRPTLPLDSPQALQAPAPDAQSDGAHIRELHRSAHALLLARGVPGEQAVEQARRMAAAVALELLGLDQHEAATCLGVTVRTLRRDRATLRHLDRDELTT